MIKNYLNGPLPDFLKENVYVSQNNEFALQLNDAKKYLSWCIEKQVNVVGFDVWYPTDKWPIVSENGSVEGDAKYCLDKINCIKIGDLEKREELDPVFNIWTEVN